MKIGATDEQLWDLAVRGFLGGLVCLVLRFLLFGVAGFNPIVQHGARGRTDYNWFLLVFAAFFCFLGISTSLLLWRSPRGRPVVWVGLNAVLLVTTLYLLFS